MDALQQELIAVGASVTANCVPCLKFHLAKARDAGATEAQLGEAIRIGRKVRAGAAQAWDEEAAKLFPEPKP